MSEELEQPVHESPKLDEMVKAYEKVKSSENGSEVFNLSKLSSRCRLFDDSTRSSFKSSINAASECYKLFLGGSDKGGGVVDVLLKQLTTPLDVAISGITTKLIDTSGVLPSNIVSDPNSDFNNISNLSQFSLSDLVVF